MMIIGVFGEISGAISSGGNFGVIRTPIPV